MLDRTSVVKISGLFILTLLAATPAHAHGWGNWNRRDYHHRHYRHHDQHGHHGGHYPDYGKVVIDLPGSYVRVVIGGRKYYHCDGAYFQERGRYFVRVPAPRGHRLAYHDRD